VKDFRYLTTAACSFDYVTVERKCVIGYACHHIACIPIGYTTPLLACSSFCLTCYKRSIQKFRRRTNMKELTFRKVSPAILKTGNEEQMVMKFSVFVSAGLHEFLHASCPMFEVLTHQR
jgi:hypothetical protein